MRRRLFIQYHLTHDLEGGRAPYLRTGPYRRGRVKGTCVARYFNAELGTYVTGAIGEAVDVRTAMGVTSSTIIRRSTQSCAGSDSRSAATPARCQSIPI